MVAAKQNIEKLISLLSCPECGSYILSLTTAQLQCDSCLLTYPIVDGIPIFIKNPQEIKVMPLEHTSNPPPERLLNWLNDLDGYSLNIGAGNTEIKIPNCIELEYSIYKTTDVVADAHRLPFRDEVFDAVVSFNTFEHLQNPFIAAKEILRVLKPGGKVVIHTAFLQPLHEQPAHYYNATKYGILNWFSSFDVESCEVLEEFNPALTMAWLTSEILYFVKEVFGAETREKLAQTTLEDCRKLWGNENNRTGFLWDTLVNLPQAIQEKFAAGFKVQLTKPIKTSRHDKQMLNNSAPALHPLALENPSIDLKIPSMDTSNSLQAIEQKRALVIGRLQAAKMCEIMGNNPWSLISNCAYNQCENPCISVIVTLFNYSEYIYECLDSITNSQSDLPAPIEVLVVDDCSSDRSASIVEEYQQKSRLPICLIKKSFNTGLADARNVGLKVARSPYVFILDADNWIDPNCLSILYHTINSSIYAGVYSSIRRVNHQTREELAGLISSEEWNVQKLVECPYIDAMAMLNREILMKVGGYSTELIEYGWFGWEDYDLWLKLAQLKYSCKLVPKVLSSYRVHPTSMINTTNYYTLTIARYFTKKFSDLVKTYGTDRLFGFENSDIFPSVQQLEECKLEQADQRLQELQEQVDKNLQELQQAYTTIAAMQSSKFWQFRNKWFKVKQRLGLGDGTEVKI